MAVASILPFDGGCPKSGRSRRRLCRRRPARRSGPAGPSGPPGFGCERSAQSRPAVQSLTILWALSACCSSMRSALLAVLTRLLFPREDEDLGVQHEHFRQRLFELPAEVHALAHRIDPQLGNRRDPLFAMDHEGERPEGVTLAVGTVAGRLAATAVSEGERAGKGVGREIETGDKLPFAPPKTVGGRAGGCGSHSILYVSIHADRFEKQTISSRKPKKMPDRRLRAGQERRLSPEASIRRGARTWLVQPLPSCQEQRVKEFLTHYTRLIGNTSRLATTFWAKARCQIS